MCARPSEPSSSPDRREQILAAAMTCFARRGLHQTTMQDISEEAGISVGLIYRYFESKEQVIATMAAERLAELHRKFAEARSMPNLVAALEHVLWCEHDAELAASFVVDLLAEAARNAHVHGLVAQIHELTEQGVTALIAESSEAKRLRTGITAGQAAEMVFHSIRGQLFDEIVAGKALVPGTVQRNRTAVLHRIVALLFDAPGDPGNQAVPDVP